MLALLIARLEAAREELAEARHLATMGVTAAAIAHEVKNSLNGISVTLDLLASGAYGERLGDPPVKHVRRLAISTAETGRAVEVNVVDTGAGIDRAVRDRLFQPFVTTKRTGTGLGLAIARRVIEAHGGRIEALANPEGGTILRLRIPLRAPAAYPSVHTEARTAIASP